jgi:CxxC motif-containing protein (DUF1111 family)
MVGLVTRSALCRAVLVCALLPLGCAEAPSSSNRVRIDRPGLPLAEATPSELERFKEGDALFEATVRPSDGLGPLYIRDACAACHAQDGRGPGVVTKVIARRAASAATLAQLLPHGPTERPYMTAGAKQPLLAPKDPSFETTARLPPAVFGRGYLEAIGDDELERLAEAARNRRGSARGRLHRLGSGAIGRLGIKARLASVHDVTVDALSGDMGLTSPDRPDEPTGPEGLRDDDKPGVDFSAEQVELLRDYVRLLEIPQRKPAARSARALFEATGCGVCHVRSLQTDSKYSIAALAGVSAEVYTDLLLHDMGEALSDGLTEEAAGPREFRTAPLIGLRFLPSYLHDGRAETVEQAIAAHDAPDSEARDSAQAFRGLSAAARSELIQFVETL